MIQTLYHVRIYISFVSQLKTWVGCVIPQLRITPQVLGELIKSLMNQCDWYLTRNDVQYMEITTWETNICAAFQVIAVLVKAWIRKELYCFCESPSQWHSLLTAGDNTTDARRQLTWHQDPEPSSGFVQSQGCTHVQSIARSKPEMMFHPSNTSVQSSVYQMKPFLISVTQSSGWWGGGMRASTHWGRWWNLHPVTAGLRASTKHRLVV